MRKLTTLLLFSAGILAAQPVIQTIAGGPYRFPPTTSALGAPLGTVPGVAIDGVGNVYGTDSSSHVVFQISPAGMMTLRAGNGTKGYSGDGGSATGDAGNPERAGARGRLHFDLRYWTRGDNARGPYQHSWAGQSAGAALGPNVAVVLSEGAAQSNIATIAIAN